jgi:hypothetical protein
MARMSRLASRLYLARGDSGRRADARQLADELAQPDLRGICGRDGPPGRSSPEAVASGLWTAWSTSGSSAAQLLLAPGHRQGSPDLAALVEGWRAPVRLSWVAALHGNERGALVIHEIEAGGGHDGPARCARTSMKWTAEGWLATGWPQVDRDACPR